MFARVTIHGDETGEVIHVPREALIRGGAIDRVVVALGEGRFRSVPVNVGIESGDRVAILDGISAGDPVVVSGQFLIDSESNIEAALSNLGEEQDMDHGAHGDMDHGEHQQATPMDHSQRDGMDHSQHQPSEPTVHSEHGMEPPQ